MLPGALDRELNQWKKCLNVEVFRCGLGWESGGGGGGENGWRKLGRGFYRNGQGKTEKSLGISWLK